MENDDLIMDLLRQTRAAILAADFPVLDDLAIAIRHAITSLDPTAPLPDIQLAATGNARLLAAALGGIQAARHRMTEVISARGCTIYRADGQRAPLQDPHAYPPRRR